MKKILIGLLLFVFLFATGCSCAVEKKAVEQVENSHALIATKLLQYVEADAKLSAKDKNDWKQLVASDKQNIDALKKALK